MQQQCDEAAAVQPAVTSAAAALQDDDFLPCDLASSGSSNK
jgi:hypothetical protein